ncbi:hypothetical protein HAX54_024645 [Datura stramonium]|uniref:Uncharacterized protein n=1 Tax=Datura stramonium TaxID=4076 RepID=A0ABS8RK27_DATST|nr:hypothetical protein [Datura stramonium]
MKCFLKDADMKQEEDEAATIRNWVSEIRAVAYHAEDVIEIFIHQVESQKRQSFFINRERYGIRHIQGLGDGEGSNTTREKMRELQCSSPLVANKDAVGLEKHVSSVVSILLKEDKRLCVASIVGMGVVGKRTLAKEVYNQTQIRDKFDIRAWSYVSQAYKPMKIIKELILQLANPEEDKVKIVDTMYKLSEAGLEEMLQRSLVEACYLIVLDDIWTTEAWDLIVRSFPDNDKSSRLLVTSRRKEVASHADAHTTPYKLKVLGEKESWELFLKKAFAEDRECPQDLVDVGKEIPEKCDGLPLASTVIVSLLAGKMKQRSEWKRVQRNLASHVVKNQTYGVSTILALSYQDLPPHLESFFLYLGLLPKSKDITVKKVMHIWVAHGLIHQKGEQKLEDIVEDYLDELISRNMVQAKEEIFLEVDNPSISLSGSRHRVLYSPLKSCTSSFKLLKLLYIDSPGFRVIS